MELIKKLGTRPPKIGFNVSSWRLFRCPFCSKKIKRRLSTGRRQQSCGCMWQILRLKSAGVPVQEYKIKNDFCKIPLFNRKHEIIGHAIIDKKDITKCKQYHWTLNDGYVKTSAKLLLHHLILGHPPSGLITDHKDNNPLNNRRDNIHHVTYLKNAHKQCKRCDNTSGFKGVSWHRRKWCARIMVNYKAIWLGYSDNPVTAALEYNKAAILYHGKFAILNKGV